MIMELGSPQIWIRLVESSNTEVSGASEVPQGCASLENIVLPSTLNVIGKQAFRLCESLRTVVLHGGMQLILDEAFWQCDLLDCVRVPCTALVITWNGEYQNLVLARDGFTPGRTHNTLVIASECFNSICRREISVMESAIMRIVGEEYNRRSHRPWDNGQCSEWDEKDQRLRALLAPHEKRHKSEIASLLELRLWKAEMETLGDDSDARTRAECRPQRGVEMIQDNVLSFLHFLR